MYINMCDVYDQRKYGLLIYFYDIEKISENKSYNSISKSSSKEVF